MKRIAASALLLVLLLLCAGCVVRSVQPWLSDESRVAEPSLLGSWHDAKNNVVAFFTGSPEEYQVLSVNDGKDASRFVATLHRIDETLLLVVGPVNPDNMEGCALLPGYILLKAAFDGDSLKLFSVDLDSFADRAAKTPVALLAGGSVGDGFALTGTAAESEAFLRAQLADPEFFDEDPLYSFRKLPAANP